MWYSLIGVHTKNLGPIIAQKHVKYILVLDMDKEFLQYKRIDLPIFNRMVHTFHIVQITDTIIIRMVTDIVPFVWSPGIIIVIVIVTVLGRIYNRQRADGL